MTTAAELIARTECADLRAKLDTAQLRIADLEACKFRLNRTINEQTHTIDNLHAELAKAHANVEHMQAELDAARAGLLELPY